MKTKNLYIVAALAVAAYLVYRYNTGQSLPLLTASGTGGEF
jgi:hypothetical protein